MPSQFINENTELLIDKDFDSIDKELIKEDDEQTISKIIEYLKTDFKQEEEILKVLLELEKEIDSL